MSSSFAFLTVKVRHFYTLFKHVHFHEKLSMAKLVLITFLCRRNIALTKVVLQILILFVYVSKPFKIRPWLYVLQVIF